MRKQHTVGKSLLLSTGIALVSGLVVLAVHMQLSGHHISFTPVAKASGPTLHWPHNSLPVHLRVVNYSTTRVWPKHIDLSVTDWQRSGVVAITQKEAGSDICNLVYGEIGVCSFNQPNTNLISWSQRGAQADGHILFGQINFNDAYLVSDATYGNVVWRNYMMCYSLGFTLGLDQQIAPPEGGNSCMESTTFTNVKNQQHPSNVSLTALKSAYDHLDASRTLPETTSAPTQVSSIAAPQSWGKLVFTSSDGAIRYYRADLDNGNILYTTAVFDQGYKK